MTVSHRTGPPARTIGSPAELQAVMRTAYRVSDQQWAAVHAPLEPAVVIAGAGSGKTSLMAARVVYLVATGQVHADEVLGLTFTSKAAAELRARVRDALASAGHDRLNDDGELLEPSVATYNAYAAGLLNEHGLRIGHEPDVRVMADASRYQLAARAVARHTRPVALLSDDPKTVIDRLLALEGAMSEHLVSFEDVLRFDASQVEAFTTALAANRAKADIHRCLSAIESRAELLGLVRTYRRLKADLGLMDFSDQIALGARLAVEQPAVGEAERESHRIVLLDEYQDTSVAQARMLGALFSGPAPEVGRGHPVTAVGDPNQAIYGWRGASVSNILGFGHDFPRADGSTEVRVLPLTVNRRSDVRILELANRLAGPLYDGSAQVQPLEAQPGAGPGDVRVLLHETYVDELAWLAEEVIRTQQSVTAGSWKEIGVLVRDNKHAADIFDRLSRHEIPVEIVGLSGLLALPEVAEVLATLTLMHDLTANAQLLTLLTGPRWAIGPRDLALLGRRAATLADARGRTEGRAPLEEALEQAVAGADPTEIVALVDALGDPGELDYSAAARERFLLLDHELRQLRQHVGEPLLDLVRRIIDTCGIDVELASSLSPAARARRENLDLFVKAIAEFQAIDGDVTLPALLAYLTAEDEMGNGLDVATPTAADSVKLLTVHRAKGLEWDAVFLVGVANERFPATRGRSLWPTSSWVLPTPLRGDARDLPALRGHAKPDLDRFRTDSRAHDEIEERRLGYVAFTRARHQLWVSAYVWRPGRKTPNGPSPFQLLAKHTVQDHGGAPDVWCELPEEGATNPLLGDVAAVPWPVTEQTAEALRRIEAAERVRAVDLTTPAETTDRDLDLYDGAAVAEWDAAIEVLLAEAAREVSLVVEVPLPGSLSATSLAALREDRETFARDLARPMPRQPSPAARFGTRFHAWVESRFGQQQMIDPDELSGRADAGIDDEDDLRELVARFEEGPFGDRTPYAVEPPFALVLTGQVVRGRIDAVYTDGDGYLLVDWKTNRAEDADPLQLAIYRVAWAELMGLDPALVQVAFHYVRTGRTVRYRAEELPDRAALEATLRV